MTRSRSSGWRRSEAAMSPYTSQMKTLDVVEMYGVEYVLVNGAFEEPYHDFLADWDPRFKTILDAKLGTWKGVFKRVYETDDITVYKVESTAFERISWDPAGPVFRAAAVRDAVVRGIERRRTGSRDGDACRAGPGPPWRGDPRHGAVPESSRATPRRSRCCCAFGSRIDVLRDGGRVPRRQVRQTVPGAKRRRVSPVPHRSRGRSTGTSLRRSGGRTRTASISSRSVFPSGLGETDYEVQWQLVEEPLFANFSDSRFPVQRRLVRRGAVRENRGAKACRPMMRREMRRGSANESRGSRIRVCFAVDASYAGGAERYISLLAAGLDRDVFEPLRAGEDGGRSRRVVRERSRRAMSKSFVLP